MTREDELQRGIEDALEIGERNLKVMQLAKNWCRHIQIERSPFRGVGIPEQMTGLPISPRVYSCPFATSPRGGMNTKGSALAFYDENCVGCEDREPVGIPNLLELVEERDQEIRDREAAKVAAAAAANSALDVRERRRQQVAESCDQTQKGLIALISELDLKGGSEQKHRLTEAAKAAPGRFSDDMRGLPFDLVESGSNVGLRWVSGSGGWWERRVAALVTYDQHSSALFRSPCLVDSRAALTVGTLIARDRP